MRLPTIILVSLLLATNYTASPTEAEPQGFTVVETGIEYAGHQIAFPCTEKQLSTILGPPGEVNTWEAFGLYVYTTPDRRHIHTIEIHLDQEFIPAVSKMTAFSGHINVGGQSLNRITGKRQLRLAGFQEDDDIQGWWERSVGSMYVIATLDPLDTHVVSIEIGMETDDE